MLAFLSTFLGLLLALKGYAGLVLGAYLAYMLMTYPPQKNINPMFFQPSSDLYDSMPYSSNGVDDPLGLYQGYAPAGPILLTRSYF